jgi:hypothetical protein
MVSIGMHIINHVCLLQHLKRFFIKLILNLLALASLKNKNMIEINGLSEINSNSISNFIGVISWGVSAPITRLAKFR